MSPIPRAAMPRADADVVFAAAASPAKRIAKRAATMHPTAVALLVLAGLATSSSAAFAAKAQPLVVYDNFNAPLIDLSKWPGELESVRDIVSKQLHLKSRVVGTTTSDSGYTSTSQGQNFPNPLAVTAIRAVIKVSDIEVTGCATNPSATQSRARIVGEFFNASPATPGSSLNDVSVQVRLNRASDTTDAPGLMHVQGVVNLCTDSACLGVTQLGFVDMGTATVGQSVTVQFQWDKPNKQFLFARDGGASTAAPYTVSDALAASTPFAGFGLRSQVPNCTAATRPNGFVDASFDNFSVNQSAIPN